MGNPTNRPRIALHVSGAYTGTEYQNAVSGHVQVPTMTANLLHNHGHHVTILTTKPRPGNLLPKTIPKGVEVVTFTDASRVWPKKRPDPLKTALHISELSDHLNNNSYDIVHFWGYTNVLILAGLLKLSKPDLPVMVTYFSSINRGKWSQLITNLLVKKINGIFTLTPWTTDVTSKLLERPVETCQPGIIKEIKIDKKAKKDSVLFWRNASYTNGADVALAAFDKLSLDYPQVNFRFAVRPYDQLENEISNLAQQRKNIHLHLFPYKDGHTLDSLISRSHCCVFPFRTLSINPQYSILESMYAGCPIVVSDAESNVNLVEHGRNGLIIPQNDIQALVEATAKLLNYPKEAQNLGKAATKDSHEYWNWQSYYKSLQAGYLKNAGVKI